MKTTQHCISLLLLGACVAASRRFADNLGYGEVGAYGGGILRGALTPRIDKLASEGMRLLNFNVEAQCTPSRSAIMTGRFSMRSGTHWNAGPAMQIVVEFEQSLKQYPPIAPGTPDPYTPPK
jgi:hypothetical protein